MLFNIILVLLLISLFIHYYYFRDTNIPKRIYYQLVEKKPEIIINNDFPKILHLMYFPWDWKNGKLKDNQFDFNHQGYEEMKEKNKDWEVKLWTLNKTKKFVEEFYPQYNEIYDLIKHPVQLVDFFRLLVVYHYGGIYWQYDSKQNSSLETFIPPENKKDRLFIECFLNKHAQIKIGNQHKIRNNKPEEMLRIATQCFSSFPESKFLKYAIDKSWVNLHNLELKEAYDILYIGGNAMFSEAYDEYKNKEEILLTYNTECYIKFSSKSSWRLENY